MSDLMEFEDIIIQQSKSDCCNADVYDLDCKECGQEMQCHFCKGFCDDGACWVCDDCLHGVDSIRDDICEIYAHCESQRAPEEFMEALDKLFKAHRNWELENNEKELSIRQANCPHKFEENGDYLQCHECWKVIKKERAVE